MTPSRTRYLVFNERFRTRMADDWQKNISRLRLFGAHGIVPLTALLFAAAEFSAPIRGTHVGSYGTLVRYIITSGSTTLGAFHCRRHCQCRSSDRPTYAYGL